MLPLSPQLILILIMNINKGIREDFKFSADFHTVVPYETGNIITKLDLSSANETFASLDHSNADLLSGYIDELCKKTGATYLIGGYAEDRNMYRRSNLFSDNLSPSTEKIEEPRSLHLGTDIWGAAGTPVFIPIGGMIHSFKNNDNYGDYGPTIIIQHHIDLFTFYTLYGHLSIKDLGEVRVGQFIGRGECFAHFGSFEENGKWPPHLHFQIINEIDLWEGDYPGVCKPGEADKWLANSPDPELILRLDQFTT